ncbi:Serine phosphatase RsbU, regulator of sigma subunit [Quadrisphaera granulorum]|uniref:protein-serine/threonine phosphatase n=2 Tax=Quadrisphaera granulorum TaxID=317664 RepID=A0A315ZKB9_9ACTN|nr:serine phosphatase RsbU (regulator of sigma subunit) [Quadrisphaera granulorum]SZE99154.1 Serine phosphatase RsbU, regulator of sigma subunit [Quadrisphaera granulorum]
MALLEALPDGFALLDADWRFTWVNDASARLAGSTREAMIGEVAWDVLPLRGTPVEAAWRTARAEHRETVVEVELPGDPPQQLEVRAWPDGDGLATSTVDVTARHRAHQQVERSARRSSLLTRSGAELGGAVGVQEASKRLAHLVVPAVADWCVVMEVEGDEQLARGVVSTAGWWHRDSRCLPLVGVLVRPSNPDDDARPVPRLDAAQLHEARALFGPLGQGRPVVIAHGAAALMSPSVADPEARAALAQLDPESVVIIPLRGRYGLVGLLACFTDRGRPAPDPEDIALLTDLARRGGLAIEAARLRDEQQRLGEALQRSLLTAPPQLPGCEVAVRYVPAAHSAHVGGDWYDAFAQDSQQVVLVIGDVVGHDSRAAADMGQVRGILRGLGVSGSPSPAQLLATVDTAMARLRLDTTATALVARLERDPARLRRGGGVLRWCSAGHLPPLVVEPGVSARLLPGRTGLLLGVEQLTGGTPRSDLEAELPPGTTLLLCTDGLVERRGTPLDAGLEQLRRALEDYRALPLPQLCDAVVRRLLPAHPEDDVALLAVRLRPA